jgi:hypothetical protein
MLGLSDSKAFGDRSYGQWLTKQKIDDLEPAWFGKRSEHLEHQLQYSSARLFPVKE